MSKLVCAFCISDKDLETCSWPAWKPALIRAGDLTLEDTIFTKGGRQLKPLMVQTVDRIVSRYWLLYKGINETVSVMRNVACGAGREVSGLVPSLIRCTGIAA